MTCAYVFLVMKDELYALGAMAAAFSLKLTKPKFPVICMITEDIKTMVPFMNKIFDKIVTVPYIEAPTNSLKTSKQTNMYLNWKDISFTKWNCLNLVEYEKVLLVDADKVILQNLDHLFNLSAPAGTFSSPHSEHYMQRGGIKDPYYNLKHGNTVSLDQIRIGIFGEYNKSSFTVIGTSILIAPNKDHYKHFCSMMKQYNNSKPFGLPCYSMTDEQSIVYFYYEYLPKLTKQPYKWTYISQKYNWISWRYNWLRSDEFPPSVIHYFGKKPWLLTRTDWLDLDVWYKFVIKMINDVFSDKDENNKEKNDNKEDNKEENKQENKQENKEQNEKELISHFYRKSQLEISQSGCFYCGLIDKDDKSHSFMNDDCKIICPHYLSQL